MEIITVTLGDVKRKKYDEDKNFKPKKKETENKDGFEQIIINI